MPKVSVTIPVYNAARYVSEAVESILTQTYTDWELLLLDDGSTDGTTGILKDYASRDSRLSWWSTENRGVGAARVDLCERASGEFIATLDSDDVAMPSRLERQVAYLEEHENVVALGSNLERTDPYGLTLETTDLPLNHEEIHRELLKGRTHCLPQTTAMMRKDAYVRIGGYSGRLKATEDLDLFLRMAEVGRLSNLSEALVRGRVHPGSVTATRSTESLALRDEILQAAYARLDMEAPAEKPWHNWKGRSSPRKLHEQWLWNALRSGRKDIARRHALSLLRISPLDRHAWRAALCALRGY